MQTKAEDQSFFRGPAGGLFGSGSYTLGSDVYRMAKRGARASANGLNPASFMPNGSRMRSLRNTLYGFAGQAMSATRARVSNALPAPLYCHLVPG